MSESKPLEIAEVKSAIEEGVKPLKDTIDTKIKTVEDRLTKIEALPLSRLGFNINSIPSEYKGYKLSEQGIALKESALKTPNRFKIFGDEGKTNDFCKFFIAIIKALKGDWDAKADLKEIYQKAQLQEDTSSEGGYLVPVEYEWDIIQLARAKSFALDLCSIINMTRDILNVPSEASLISVAWTAEEGAMPQSEPTFGQVQLNARRLDGYGKVTNELLQDSAIDIVSLLVEQFAYAIGMELDNQVLNGTGTPVSGVLTAAAGNSVVMATGNTSFSAVTGTNLSDIVYTLNTGDLANARYILGRLGMHYVRTLKDSNNNFIFAKVGEQVGGTIWGFPYFVSEKVTNTSAANTAFISFGDFKKFYIGRRLGAMALDLDPYSLFTTYATQFRMVTRWGMAIGRASAFCRLLTAAT